VDTTSDFTVPLSVGWNQIGCPFTSAINWGDLKVVNGTSVVDLATAAANGLILEYGWMYDSTAGNYKLVHATMDGADRTVAPWHGYWIKCLASNCSLRIPSPSGGVPDDPFSVHAASLKNKRTLSSIFNTGADSGAKWKVILQAKNGAVSDNYRAFGVSQSKAQQLETPGGLSEYVSIYFPGKDGKNYASDLKAASDTHREWHFNVDTDLQGEVVLTWAGIENLTSSLKFTLVDADGKSMEMLPGGSYTFTAGRNGASKAFTVRVENR
jgi:hypothetical protein